jgi:hypothetical protein
VRCHEQTRTDADSHFGAAREVEITLDKPYKKELPLKLNRLGIPDKNRYRTGDLSQLLGVSADTIRWRFRTGIYPKAVPDGNGRIFSLSDIQQILQLTSTLNKSAKPSMEQQRGEG